MTLSGPTKLRSTNGNSWHKLPLHKHRIRSKGDYRLPRVRGATRVSRWWADGGARRSLALSLSGAYYCHCRQETSLHMQTLVSHSTKWQRIDMVLRSGGVGSLAGRVLSGSPFSGGCGVPHGSGGGLYPLMVGLARGPRRSFGFTPLGRVPLSLSSRDKSPHAGTLRDAFN